MLNLTQNYSRGRKRMIIQIKKVMIESTNYLDMNKKRCHPKNLSLFLKKKFQPELDRSIDRFFELPTSQPKNPPKNHSSLHFFFYSPRLPPLKKFFHAFPKNIFFSHPDRGSNSPNLNFFHRAPPPPIPRAHARVPPPPPPQPREVNHVHFSEPAIHFSYTGQRFSPPNHVLSFFPTTFHSDDVTTLECKERAL